MDSYGDFTCDHWKTHILTSVKTLYGATPCQICEEERKDANLTKAIETLEKLAKWYAQGVLEESPEVGILIDETLIQLKQGEQDDG